jgi:hypothetical protein
VVEEKNRHILEIAHVLLHGINVLTHHWDDAVSTVVYLLNRMPSKVLHFKTPLQVFSSHVALPTVLLLRHRVFGCMVFVHLHKNQRSKLDPCVVKCLFQGYGLNKKGYKCFDPICRTRHRGDLKNFHGKEQISGILFFDGEMSCLRSRHLVLR